MKQVEKAIFNHAKDGWRFVQALVAPKKSWCIYDKLLANNI